VSEIENRREKETERERQEVEERKKVHTELFAVGVGVINCFFNCC
jgi:hypothetical protein